MLLRVNVAALSVLVGLSLLSEARAQKADEPPRVTTIKKSVSVSVDPKDAKENIKADDVAIPGMLHRASEIAGMKVRNGANKELGSVKDTVIDVRAGKVRYVALSYGGFLGLGDKLFAVPFDALIHHHGVSGDAHYFVLNIDEETLKQSPGFDQDTWPNFADAKFNSGIDKYYEKFRRPADRRAGVSVNSNNGQVKIEVNRKPKTADQATDKPAESIVLRASLILGMKVQNEAKKDLGTVNDLVIEMGSGKIRYAALSYGGVLGLGDKLFAVPWSAFECRHDVSNKDYTLVLNIDESRLRKASGFDKDKWPNFADPRISDEIDKYYGLPGARVEATGGAIIRERKDR